MPIFDPNIFDPAIFDTAPSVARIGIFDPAIFDPAIFDTGETAELSCTLNATESQDTAVFIAAHQLDCTLNAVEAQDTAYFSVAHESLSVELQPGRSGRKKKKARTEWPATPVFPILDARLYAVEEQDTASFKLAFDYADDEIVMMLMQAAWETEEETEEETEDEEVLF